MSTRITNAQHNEALNMIATLQRQLEVVSNDCNSKIAELNGLEAATVAKIEQLEKDLKSAKNAQDYYLRSYDTASRRERDFKAMVDNLPGVISSEQDSAENTLMRLTIWLISKQ